MVYVASNMTYTIGDVSRLAGITIRTLHHYDEIGLLRPGGRTGAGYRVYNDGDLRRLQQVLFYRELGFGIEEIGGAPSKTSGNCSAGRYADSRR